MDKFSLIMTGICILIIICIFGLLFATFKNEEDYGIKEGTVINKEHNSRYTSFVYSGKVLVPISHPGSWKLQLQKEAEGKVKTIWIDVSEEEYKKINIGDYWEAKAYE